MGEFTQLETNLLLLTMSEVPSWILRHSNRHSSSDNHNHYKDKKNYFHGRCVSLFPQSNLDLSHTKTLPLQPWRVRRHLDCNLYLHHYWPLRHQRPSAGKQLSRSHWQLPHRYSQLWQHLPRLRRPQWQRKPQLPHPYLQHRLCHKLFRRGKRSNNFHHCWRTYALVATDCRKRAGVL